MRSHDVGHCGSQPLRRAFSWWSACVLKCRTCHRISLRGGQSSCVCLLACGRVPGVHNVHRCCESGGVAGVHRRGHTHTHMRTCACVRAPQRPGRATATARRRCMHHRKLKMHGAEQIPELGPSIAGASAMCPNSRRRGKQRHRKNLRRRRGQGQRPSHGLAQKQAPGTSRSQFGGWLTHRMRRLTSGPLRVRHRRLVNSIDAAPDPIWNLS